MARPSVPALTTVTKRKIVDVDGRPLASFGVSEKARPDATGGVRKEKVLESIMTVDGHVYHTGMDRNLVKCTSCQRGLEATLFHKAERPTHGLCLEANAVRCSRPGCLAWCCPRHAHRDADGQWLCRDCEASWDLWAFFRSIFFYRVED